MSFVNPTMLSSKSDWGDRPRKKLRK